MKICLGELGIDAETLVYIKNYCQEINYEPKNLEWDSILDRISLTNVFKNINEENLLLLVLAAHRLGLECLQNDACAKIAEIYNEDLENAEANEGEDTYLNIVEDKHLDICLNSGQNIFRKVILQIR